MNPARVITPHKLLTVYTVVEVATGLTLLLTPACSAISSLPDFC